MSDELCPHCPHRFDDHLLRTVLKSRMAGWIVCPVDGCDCWSTWAAEHPDLPPDVRAAIDQEIARLRRLHDRGVALP